MVLSKLLACGFLFATLFWVGCSTIPPGHTKSAVGKKKNLSADERREIRDRVVAYLERRGFEFTEDDWSFKELAPVKISEEGKCSLDFSTSPANGKYANLRHLRFVRNLPAPLEKINVSGTKVRDLSPLARTEVVEVAASYTRVSDLSPLADRPLEGAVFCSTGVSDISVLRGMPLRYALFSSSPVRDISPLEGAPLIQVGVVGTKVTDLRPLAGMELEFLGIPPQKQITEGLEDIRKMKTLKSINRDSPENYFAVQDW